MLQKKRRYKKEKCEMDDFFADCSSEIKHENHVNHDHQQPVIMQYQYPINQPMDGFLESRKRF
jgi:hypothetical protein